MIKYDLINDFVHALVENAASTELEYLYEDGIERKAPHVILDAMISSASDAWKSWLARWMDGIDWARIPWDELGIHPYQIGYRIAMHVIGSGRCLDDDAPMGLDLDAWLKRHRIAKRIQKMRTLEFEVCWEGYSRFAGKRCHGPARGASEGYWTITEGSYTTGSDPATLFKKIHPANLPDAIRSIVRSGETIAFRSESGRELRIDADGCLSAR